MTKIKMVPSLVDRKICTFINIIVDSFPKSAYPDIQQVWIVRCCGAFMPQALLSAYPTFFPLPLTPLSGFGSNFVAR